MPADNKKTDIKCTVIIPAAGSGKRFGSPLPKQFLNLWGAPVIIHTLSLFDSIAEISSIVLAVSFEWKTYIENKIVEFGIKKVSSIVSGGSQRQDSIMNALNTDIAAESDIVLVHDAVRPFASPGLVRRVIEGAAKYGAAIPAIAPKDTIKQIAAENFVAGTPDRNTLCMVQTPQGFNTNLLRDAYRQCAANNWHVTDDSSLVEKSGHKVKIVDGEDTNLKITTQSDMMLSEIIMHNK